MTASGCPGRLNRGGGLGLVCSHQQLSRFDRKQTPQYTNAQTEPIVQHRIDVRELPDTILIRLFLVSSSLAQDSRPEDITNWPQIALATSGEIFRRGLIEDRLTRMAQLDREGICAVFHAFRQDQERERRRHCQ